ncbi:MAG TPA: alpha/beta hydrolase [Verrucomicrobiae bacterium]
MKDIPLLLIHGYPFDHTLWFATIASLGSKAKVIVPDLPGFGKEPPLREAKPSMEAYADFLARALDDQKTEKVAVAGMSMGGYVALAFAEKFPQRTACLGLISTQAAPDSPDAKQARVEIIEKIRAKGPGIAAETILPKMFSDARPANPDLQNYPTEGAQKAGADGLSWALRAMAARPDRTEFLHSFNHPVLVVHGSEDKIIPFTKARAMAENCLKPIFIEVPGAGHATPLENPDAVANGLVRLLAACAESANQ